MVKRNAAILAPLAIAGAALPGVWVASASATDRSNGGEVQFYQVDVSASSPTTGLVTITGAIDDSGVDYEGINNSNFNLIKLSQGSFLVDLTNFGTGNAQLSVNANCSYQMTITGTIPIVPGSGKRAYAGISGTFNVTDTSVGVLPRLTGANGQCDTNQAGSASVGDIIQATANVSF